MADLEVWRANCRMVVSKCKNEYAQAYARAGLEMTGWYEISVQAIYILNNIQHWRGDTARCVRIYMKQVAKDAECESIKSAITSYGDY